MASGPLAKDHHYGQNCKQNFELFFSNFWFSYSTVCKPKIFVQILLHVSWLESEYWKFKFLRAQKSVTHHNIWMKSANQWQWLQRWQKALMASGRWPFTQNSNGDYVQLGHSINGAILNQFGEVKLWPFPCTWSLTCYQQYQAIA
jgi:hypothetical protein